MNICDQVSIMGTNSMAKRRSNIIKLFGLIFLLLQEIAILQALPQRVETSNEPTSAVNTMMREATVEPNVAKTLPRKVDNRIETQKVTSTRTTVTKKDDSVKFPTNRPATIAPTRPPPPMTPASRIRTDNLAIDPEDRRKCDQNFLECRRLSNYPTDIVERLILEGKVNKNLLLNEDTFKAEVDTRIEGSGDDSHGNKKQFCSYKEDIFYPEGGKNNVDQYRFIVQAPKYNFTQGIRTETCVSEGDNSCGGIKSYLPDHYQVQCVQKYAYKQFVTVSNTGTGTTQEPIKIPSCCVCMYTDKK